MSQANIAVASTDRDDFLAFEREFNQNLKELAEALTQSNAAITKSKSVAEKGTWKMVWGALNGDNHKDLADITGKLALSLNVTQKVLDLVMKVSNRKNGFLKQFHEVLVKKITNLTNDTQTLDSNQREATLAILEEFEHQVSGQLVQSEMVERHQERLESIDRYIEAADLRAAGDTAQLALFSANLVDLRAFRDSMTARIELEAKRHDETVVTVSNIIERTHKAEHSLAILGAGVANEKLRLDEFEGISQGKWQNIADLNAMAARLITQLEELESTSAEQRALIDAQRATIDQESRFTADLAQALVAADIQVAAQAKRIDSLEILINKSKSLPHVMLRHAPAILAIVLATGALLQTG